MRLSQVLRPAWSLAAFGLALSLLAAPMVARAQDDEDNDKDHDRQGTIRIYGRDDDAARGGYLGVQVQDVTRTLQRARNLPTEEGALVSRVENDSPADRNGIRRGDVIVEVDRQKIENSADLIRVVRGLEAGSKIRVTLWRSGSLRTVTAELGERPKGAEMRMPPEMERWPGGRGGNDTPAPFPGMVDSGQVRQQIRELQDQLQELRNEVRSLREELRRSSGDRDDHNNDNDRSHDDDEDGD